MSSWIFRGRGVLMGSRFEQTSSVRGYFQRVLNNRVLGQAARVEQQNAVLLGAQSVDDATSGLNCSLGGWKAIPTGGLPDTESEEQIEIEDIGDVDELWRQGEYIDLDDA